MLLILCIYTVNIIVCFALLVEKEEGQAFAALKVTFAEGCIEFEQALSLKKESPVCLTEAESTRE